MEILRLIWPIIVIQYIFAIVAILDIVKNKNTRIFSWEIWIFVVLFINLFGPLLYFLVGKEED